MSKWTHSICEACWNNLHPNRKAVRAIGDGSQRCCFCNALHDSGIYVREDSANLLCQGKGTEHD